MHCGFAFSVNETYLNFGITALCLLCPHTSIQKRHTNAVLHCCLSLAFFQAFKSLTFYFLVSVFPRIPFLPVPSSICHLYPFSLFLFLLFSPLSSFQRAQSHGVQSTRQEGNPKSRESHLLYVIQCLSPHVNLGRVDLGFRGMRGFLSLGRFLSLCFYLQTDLLKLSDVMLTLYFCVLPLYSLLYFSVSHFTSCCTMMDIN